MRSPQEVTRQDRVLAGALLDRHHAAKPGEGHLCERCRFAIVEFSQGAPRHLPWVSGSEQARAWIRENS